MGKENEAELALAEEQSREQESLGLDVDSNKRGASMAYGETPPGPDLTPGLAKGDEPKPAEDKSQAQEWDKDRQRRDQEHANERKQLLDQINELQAERQSVQAQLNELVAKPGKTAEPVLDEELSVDTEYETLVQNHNKLVATIKGQNEQLSKLQSSLDQVAAGQVEAKDAAAEQEMVSSLSKEFGAQHQNAAQAMAREYLVKRGYSVSKPPSPDTTYLALRLSYQTLVNKASKGKETGVQPPPITPDSGRGGGVTSSRLSEGSLDEIAEAMQREGKT